ncbi:DUF7352 domain-containing protein [Nonomuraea dietziae]|uniref:DUF7352 domain-containing protein n=1 Tax=Nonomuraea dietziae TaxID=65515 RepID=UPI0034276DFB
MARRMLRYSVVVGGKPNTIKLDGDPLHVAAARLGVGVNAPHLVEFWAEGQDRNDSDARARRVFQVFGTGDVLPDGARWWGTTDRTPEGLVWHLYELTGVLD